MAPCLSKRKVLSHFFKWRRNIHKNVQNLKCIIAWWNFPYVSTYETIIQSKIWRRGGQTTGRPNRLTACFGKQTFSGTQTCLFVYVLSLSAFAPQWRSCGADSDWVPAKKKIFTFWSFTEKMCRPLLWNIPEGSLMPYKEFYPSNLGIGDKNDYRKMNMWGRLHLPCS